MTPNLSSFTLRMKLPDNKVQVACSQVMSYLPAKAPKLEHLALMAPEASEAGIQADFRACLEQVITTLPQLKMVEISSSLFTPSTQEALSHLQRVESLSVLACGASGDGERGRGGNPARSLNTFPALTKMTALSSSSFQEITTFIETYRPQSLHELVVASCIKEDDDADWFYVIDQVSSTCPHLRILELRGATGHMTCHAIDDFFSVLRVRLNLTSLILENTPSLLLNAPMLTELVRSLPSLATLTLNEYPSRPPTLPIFCLEAIAPMCSQMKILSLYLDTRLDADIPPLPARFECLEALNIGPSPLRSTALRTTTYLSSVLTDGCRLTRKLDTHISAGQANAKFLSWAPVIEFLPSMMELRKTSANASRIHSNSAS
ncbi:hypothetical protein EYR40_009887 [Pleurotus pulmonarius]|nr:hypothetical protein EYR40_009887 [Pleurotus pulmonarius]